MGAPEAVSLGPPCSHTTSGLQTVFTRAFVFLLYEWTTDSSHHASVSLHYEWTSPDITMTSVFLQYECIAVSTMSSKFIFNEWTTDSFKHGRGSTSFCFSIIELWTWPCFISLCIRIVFIHYQWTTEFSPLPRCSYTMSGLQTVATMISVPLHYEWTDDNFHRSLHAPTHNLNYRQFPPLKKHPIIFKNSSDPASVYFNGQYFKSVWRGGSVAVRWRPNVWCFTTAWLTSGYYGWVQCLIFFDFNWVF